jgi:hypothetical protein
MRGTVSTASKLPKAGAFWNNKKYKGMDKQLIRMKNLYGSFRVKSDKFR